MIVEPAELIWESPDWAILQISKSCWVVLPREQLLEGLQRGRRWRRADQMQERLAQREKRESGDAR
jgi:hypothetical protein